MIPLRQCDPLQLAVLSARAMGWEALPYNASACGEGQFCEAPSGPDGEPTVYWQGGRWSPAEDPGDALRLVAWAASRQRPVTMRGGSAEAVCFGASGPGSSAKPLDCESPEQWCATLCRALSEASLSALGVQGWEEPG